MIDLTESAQPLVVDLCDSDDDDEGTASTADDAAFARRLQRSFDALAAGAGPVTYDSAARDASGGDLLTAQRRALPHEVASSAGKNGARVVRLEMNEASRPGRPLYERFVAAWRRVPDKSVRLVYHATEEKNFAAILRDGLDPRRRGGKNGQMGGTGEPVRCVGTDQKSRHCGRRERATSTKRSRRRRRRGAVPTDAKRPRTGTSARRCEPRPSTAIEDRGRC